jgi:phospholipid/cholesterol/gamma-HCH transport system substrate-binding protein
MLMRGARRVRTAAGLLAVGAVVIASTSCGGPTGSRASGYCAILPDSIGLYVGNPVTQMGYPIGTVNKITPGDASVQVDFSVTDTRPLPHDAKAIIRRFWPTGPWSWSATTNQDPNWHPANASR